LSKTRKEKESLADQQKTSEENNEKNLQNMKQKTDLKMASLKVNYLIFFLFS
jgi:hypothetical protein